MGLRHEPFLLLLGVSCRGSLTPGNTPCLLPFKETKRLNREEEEVLDAVEVGQNDF